MEQIPAPRIRRRNLMPLPRSSQTNGQGCHYRLVHVERLPDSHEHTAAVAAARTPAAIIQGQLNTLAVAMQPMRNARLVTMLTRFEFKAVSQSTKPRTSAGTMPAIYPKKNATPKAIGLNTPDLVKKSTSNSIVTSEPPI